MKRILVIDVGGTNVKVGTSGRRQLLKIPSGKTMTASRMAAAVREATEGWKYDVVSIGYPGAVKRGKPGHEPRNLSGGWMRFDYEKAFGRPVKIVNDAAMQALGAYAGGRMLFLGLGTSLGSALVAEGLLMPLELAHLPYRRGRTYEDYVGVRGFVRLGRKKWTRHVHEVVELLKAGLQADYVVLGADEETQDAAARRSHQRQPMRHPGRPTTVGRRRPTKAADSRHRPPPVLARLRLSLSNPPHRYRRQ